MWHPEKQRPDARCSADPRLAWRHFRSSRFDSRVGFDGGREAVSVDQRVLRCAFQQRYSGGKRGLIPCRLIQAKSGTLWRDGRRLGRIKRKRSPRNDWRAEANANGRRSSSSLPIIIIASAAGRLLWIIAATGGPAPGGALGLDHRRDACWCCGSWSLVSGGVSLPHSGFWMLTSRRGKVLR